VQYVTVERTGQLYLNKEAVDLKGLLERVLALRIEQPDLSIVIRGSAKTKYKNVVAVMDQLQQANVGRVDLATEAIPEGGPKKE
jgi:biopolymer transport protein ExbD